MDANMVDDFDSNLEPLIDRQIGIEDRLRLLEAVTARATQTKRRRSLDSVIEPRVPVNRSCKMDISHVAKALAIDTDLRSNKIDDKYNNVVVKDCDNFNFFDCNVCLKPARDPILTCCGHLFCWSCFYNVPYADSVSKECPVCKGEVLDSNITPIYGSGDENGENSQAAEFDYVMKIPSRPRANRVDCVRQQCFSTEVAYRRQPSEIGLRNSAANIQTYVRNVAEQGYVESVGSDADMAFLRMAALITDGSVEVAQTVSRARRRRGVPTRGWRLQGESSTERRTR